MNKIIISILIIVVVALVIAFIQMNPRVSGKEQSCIDSGGTVRMSLCCMSTDDFPNMCLIGACGCSPENSHEVKVCDCPEGKCFDGNSCT